MASDFPASLDAFPDPLVNSPLNSPSHAALHQDVNDAVEKIEVKLGVGVSPASGASDGQVLMADGSGSTEWASITADEIDSTGQPAGSVLAADGAGGASWAFDSIGMWLVKDVTIGVGATSVPVTDCFTEDYDNYRVTVGFNDCNSSTTLRLQFTGLTGSNYFSNGYRIAWQSTFTNILSGAETSWNLGETFSGFASTAILDIINPQRSISRTFGQSSMAAPGFATNYLHQVTVITSTTGFTISLASGGTMTGGSIRVYGYKN
jgi:hypothetical protein